MENIDLENDFVEKEPTKSSPKTSCSLLYHRMIKESRLHQHEVREKHEYGQEHKVNANHGRHLLEDNELFVGSDFQTFQELLVLSIQVVTKGFPTDHDRDLFQDKKCREHE